MRKLLLVSFVLAGLSPITLFAASFAGITVFGDSLSDNGNALAIFQAFPGAIPPGAPAPLPPAYSTGRYTSGPDTSPASTSSGLWVDQLASKLGVAGPTPAIPAALGLPAPAGSNYAVASAQTGAGLVDMSSQVALFQAANSTGAPANSLYVFWGGANDLYNSSDPLASARVAVGNISGQISAIAAAGGREFLWLNLPSLGATPRGAANASLLNAATTQFNQDWLASIAALEAAFPGINITGIDVNSVFANILANPSAYGFMNVTTPAQGQAVNPDQYLFWDLQHPTAAAHGVVADAAFQALSASSVPEPATVVLCLLASLAGVLISRRRLSAIRSW